MNHDWSASVLKVRTKVLILLYHRFPIWGQTCRNFNLGALTRTAGGWLNWVDLVMFTAESDWIGGTLAEEILIFGQKLGLDNMGGSGVGRATIQGWGRVDR